MPSGAAFLVDRGDERIEVYRQPPVAAGDVGLDGAGLLAKDVKIVHPSEQILERLQLTNAGGHARPLELAFDLHRVAELLRRDTHGMQAFGHIHAAGVGDSFAQALGARFDALNGIADGGRPAANLRTRSNAGQLASEPVDFAGGDRVQHVAAPVQAFLGNRLTHFRNRSGAGDAAIGKLFEVLERHVELAHRAERPRHPADALAGAVDRVSIQGFAQHRKRRTKASGRHPRLVD
jgi:hypothetical protein